MSELRSHHIYNWEADNIMQQLSRDENGSCSTVHFIIDHIHI